MDRHELDRMFDGLAPDPRRERELLRQLLQDDARRKKPMKNWKRVVIGAAAAALLVTAATAATVPGISRRLLQYFGVAPEDTQTVDLLLPGAMAVDITKEDNGATLHVTQILRDRASIMVWADFTAPEGTTLYRPNGEALNFNNGSAHSPYFKDGAGERMGGYLYSSGGWSVQEEAAPEDGHHTLLFTLLPARDDQARQALQDAATLFVPAVDMGYYDREAEELVAVCPGDWSFEIPLPQRDIGYTQLLSQVIGELDGATIVAEGELYLSPISLEIDLRRQGGDELTWDDAEGTARYMRWVGLGDYNGVTLTTRDGHTVSLRNGPGGEIGNPVQTPSLCLAEVIDPARFQGGTLTLDWACGKAVIPLDGLAPVEP